MSGRIKRTKDSGGLELAEVVAKQLWDYCRRMARYDDPKARQDMAKKAQDLLVKYISGEPIEYHSWCKRIGCHLDDHENWVH